MAGKSVADFACRLNGDNASGRVSGADRSRRYQSESESDVSPTVKSFARLCSRDEDERATALEELSQGVLLCLRLDRPGSARLSKETLLYLLRLSRSCPLQEIRGRAAELLRTVQVMPRHCSRHFLLENACRQNRKIVLTRGADFSNKMHLNDLGAFLI